MKDQFVPYEIALKLKELGFDEPCFGFYDDNNSPIAGNYPCLGYNRAPLYQQAFQFLRDKFNLDYRIEDDDVYDDNLNKKIIWDFFIYKNKKRIFSSNANLTYVESFNRKEAEINCLYKLIKLSNIKDNL